VISLIDPTNLRLTSTRAYLFLFRSCRYKDINPDLPQLRVFYLKIFEIPVARCGKFSSDTFLASNSLERISEFVVPSTFEFVGRNKLYRLRYGIQIESLLIFPAVFAEGFLISRNRWKYVIPRGAGRCYTDNNKRERERNRCYSPHFAPPLEQPFNLVPFALHSTRRSPLKFQPKVSLYGHVHGKLRGANYTACYRRRRIIQLAGTQPIDPRCTKRLYRRALKRVSRSANTPTLDQGSLIWFPKRGSVVAYVERWANFQ
jgi:hypothetical protein